MTNPTRKNFVLAGVLIFAFATLIEGALTKNWIGFFIQNAAEVTCYFVGGIIGMRISQQENVDTMEKVKRG